VVASLAFVAANVNVVAVLLVMASSNPCVAPPVILTLLPAH